MKARYGFVSNSSSSSFILGYGKIQDLDAFEDYCEKHGISFYVKEYREKKYEYCDLNVYEKMMDAGERILTGGNDTELIVPRDLAQNFDYHEHPAVTVEITNNEGDGSIFWGPNDDGDSGYDKAKFLNFYSEKQKAIIELFQGKDRILLKNEVIFGAERNG